MYVSYRILFYSLTTLISYSWSSTVNSSWKKFPFIGPVTLNYYRLIPNSSVGRCAMTCWTLYNWDQIYFQGKNCYCLAPVYAEAGEVSGTVTTNREFWTTYHDVTSCSEKGYTLFLDQRYCLKYFANGDTWYNAESTCRHDGGHLHACYIQQDVYNFRSLYTDNVYTYIGAHRTLDGLKFDWITGGNVHWSFWKSGEPNNIFGIENCLDNMTYAFICQKRI